MSIGIDSISLNPDWLGKVAGRIATGRRSVEAIPDRLDRRSCMIRVTLIWLAGALLVASPASAQQQPGRHHGDTTKAMRGQPMTRETMMRMDSADARLDRLVSEMNRATGPRKVQAMVAVINELVAQRKAMRAHARQMMEGGGMMQKMQPQSADTARARPTAPDSADHSQHHEP
jgi:hypothetical protein